MSLEQATAWGGRSELSGFFEFFGEGGEGGFVHGGDGVFADAGEDGVDGFLAGEGPGAGGGGVDVAEADGFGGELEFGSALRALALGDQAGLREQGEDAAHHDGAGVEGLGDGGGGVHFFRREGEEDEDADTQSETTVLSHEKQANIGGSPVGKKDK